MSKWLFIFCYFGCMGATMSVYAQGGEKAPAAIAGKYVIDNTVAVPAGAYTTFSTVYEGKRYYLGIDTLQAKAGKDTVAWFDKPCYEAMWVVGGLYNPRATKPTDVLPDKNYLRTVKSLWIDEKCSRKRYLALGVGASTYSSLVLQDTAHSVLWYTQKDVRATGQYIQGFMYYYSDASGVDVYRYLTFNPLYGFSRAYSTIPEESQRISVWDRTTGNDITSTMTPPTWTFGLNQTQDTVRLHITSHVYYYKNIDRFRSRYDQTDIIVRAPTVYDNQAGLLEEPYKMWGFYEWASNPRPSLPTTLEQLAAQGYIGRAKMPTYQTWEELKPDAEVGSEDPDDYNIVSGWRDSTMLSVSDTLYKLDTENNLWHDTIFAIGKSPFDRANCRLLRKPADGSAPTEDDYTDHRDWLRQHFYIKNESGDYEHFVDSILVVRQTFHNVPFTTLNTTATPSDVVLNYNESPTTQDIVVSAKYVSGNNVHHANHALAQTIVGEERTLSLTGRTCYRDTIWTLDGNGDPVFDENGDPTWSDVVLYDTLLVEALLVDGTSAIGSGAGQWIQSVSLPNKSTIRVVTKAMTEADLDNRIAQIRFIYRYRHSSFPGDWAESTRSVWITQKGYASVSAEVYSFSHKDGTDKLQPVHEKKQTFYAIPGQDMQLLLHRDHWGYYRWYIYDEANRERDLTYGSTWSWANVPTNSRGDEFIVINHTNDASSRGRWDVKKDVAHPSNPNFDTDHFDVASSTPIPSIYYSEENSSADKTGKVACDVSAYYDIVPTGSVNVDLSAIVEPTLSYRQIIDIHPAKEQADAMSHCRVNGAVGTDDKWMEEHTVVVPTGKPFSLIQRYPVKEGTSDVIQRDHLQYIYYFNPTGDNDANMGIKSDSYTVDEAACFGRIGKKRTTGTPLYRAQLISPSSISVGSSKKVIMVNPRKGTGFVLGKYGSGFTAIDFPDSVRDGNTTTLQHFIENSLLNTTDVTDAYKFVLKRESESEISIENGNDYLQYDYDDGLLWTNESGRPDRTMDFSSAGSSDSYITSTQASSVKLWMHAAWWLDWFVYKEGYLMSYDYSEPCIRRVFGVCVDWGKEYSRNIYIQKKLEDDDDESNRAWLFYEIIEPDLTDHEEHPLWEKYNPSTSKWDSVAWVNGYKGDYRMLEGGELRVPINAHPDPNQTYYYRLRTEHFQLAKFTVETRDAEKVGPSTSAIISEDSIQNHFEVLYTLGNEYFPAPGESTMKAYYHHLPWSYTEMSYHYPQSVIDADHRVDGSSLLPSAGEYAYLNKFTLGGKTTNSMAGAENGYMMCIHAAQKPMTIFNFTYPQLPCPDQEIYLTFNICDPLDNAYNPQVTCELQGKAGAGDWHQLRRFKTGEVLHESGKWQQVVIPIPKALIESVDTFRCVAQLTGSTASDAYVLLDRIRFIGKERPMTVFQNKGACLETENEGNVHLVARVDYQKSSYSAGTLIAYQYQKKSGDSFVPLTVGEGVGDIPGYINDVDGTTLTENGHGYGIISIPAAAYVPAAADIVDVSEVTTKNKSYVNDGDALQAYYVMYISQQVYAHVGDTFRVVISRVTDKSDDPSFAGAGCASKRVIPIDNPIDIHVSNYTGKWPNHTRDELVGGSDEYKLREPNATYSVTTAIEDKFLPSGRLTGSGKCMFDVVRTVESERRMSGNDEWFKNRFGCSRQQFHEIMTTFRQDVAENTMRLETNWNNVTPEDFMYKGSVCEKSRAKADSMYAVLNRLIVDSAFIEIGVSSWDVYLADNNNAYAVFWPIPASGTYIDDESKETRSISVCSTPRWFEIHSDDADDALRFGWDNMFAGNYYMTPVIRASKTDANNHLKVRISEITHSEHAGVVIGWDSTYVIESNDPDWNPATKTFRYHQDRIVQDGIFDNYYKVPSKESTDPHRYVIFTPVDATYIEDLRGNTCDCYNYVASGTEWKTGTSNDVLKVPDGAPKDCNKWGVKYIAKGAAARVGTAPHDMPGYQVANNFELKAGYWYKFQTAFFDVSSTIYYNEGGDGICRGHSYFIVAVAPDTLRWTPSHPDGANYWNDDNNWTPVMYNTPADGFKAKVPMGDSHVIIPAPATDNLLPIVNNTVPRRVDTLDFGFAKNTCKQILFKPRATMLGQENLDYEKAFVDVAVKTAEYMTFSPALKYIYGGDMYIPKSADNEDFNPKTFDDGSGFSSTYNRKTPYAVYTAYYNQSVPFAYYNTDEEGTPLAYKTRSSADWVFTNTMKIKLEPGKACLLLAYDKSGANADELTIRLPKKETSYPYISNAGVVGASETMPDKPAFGDLSNNLAYNKTDLATARSAKSDEEAGITYSLTNETPSKVFFFGNPTMALIDVYKLCQDNANESDGTTPKLERGGISTSYKFTAYQLREGESSYATKVITGPGQFFVAPERSVGLIAHTERTSLDIELKPTALVGMDDGGSVVSRPFESSAPRRTISNDQLPITNYLYMSASVVADGEDVYKAYVTIGQEEGANRGFQRGEDAPNLASGMSSNAAYETPLSVYTIADNQALMLDVRDSIGRIPVVFSTLEGYEYNDYILLSFSMEGNWTEAIYLYDSFTNDSVQISNGLQIAIRRPESDQIRYFFNGNGARTSTDDDQPGITTDIEVVDDQSPITNNQSGTVIYDVLGRPVLKLSEHDLISNIQLPTGVYIIQRGKNTERMVIR